MSLESTDPVMLNFLIELFFSPNLFHFCSYQMINDHLDHSDQNNGEIRKLLLLQSGGGAPRPSRRGDIWLRHRPATALRVDVSVASAHRSSAFRMTTDPNLLQPFSNTGVSSLRQISEDAFYVVNEIVMKRLGHIPIIKGDFHLLPPKVQRFVAEKTELMRPRGIYICDGSQHEADEIIDKLVERGMLTQLTAYENNYLCRTDPKDVARVESKTWMVTPEKHQTVCHTAEGVEPIMGHWMGPDEFGTELDSRFPGCMAGRIMYVIPFSMGPVGGPLSKIGVQLSDSNYVVLSMRIMTRVGPKVLDHLGDNDFVRCIHSVGLPRPVKQKVINHWPC
uniref:PEPCK_N domain-containing protein n=1 Tax=Steinernema glaseri TaxID=37863 RepID=A0A1I7XWP9_9BILA